MSMTKIQQVTVGVGGASGINFTSIPGTYTDLMVVYSLRSNQGGFFGSVEIRLNGSASSHTQRRLRGNGSSPSSGTNSNFEVAANASGTTANTFGNGQIYIPNYTSNVAKSASIDFVMEQNATEAYQQIAAGLFNTSSAITSIEIFDPTNLVAGSSATLYGINRMSALGKQKAIGGEIYLKDGYWHHAFRSSGTFTALSPVQAEILVIAGGGSAGYDWAAGGGAGGVQYLAGSSVAAGPHVITVGSGGAGSTGGGANGSNSSFSSTVTAIGGGRGGSSGTDGASGGSGGGGNQFVNRPGGAAVSGTGGTFYGNAGGNGLRGPSGGTQEASGGGGGAGQAGQGGYLLNGGYYGGNGGNGVTAFSSWGLATSTGENVGGIVYYAGGGGGAGRAAQGSGGLGGGGDAAPVAQAGSPNTGGGGGGDTQNGGSGLVIIRYPA